MIFNEDFKKKKLKSLLDNDDSIVVGVVFVVASRPGSFGLGYWIKAKTKKNDDDEEKKYIMENLENKKQNTSQVDDPDHLGRWVVEERWHLLPSGNCPLGGVLAD